MTLSEMEVILAGVRPRPGALASTEFNPRLYDLLLLDSLTPHTAKKPARYLPMFPAHPSNSSDLRQLALTELYRLTGGDMGLGIKGERAVLVPLTQQWETQSNVTLLCVPINPNDKLHKKFTDQASNSPCFHIMDHVINTLNDQSVNFPLLTRPLLLHLETWLREKHKHLKVVESLFRPRAEYRIRLTVHNPVFIPSRLSPEETAERETDSPGEIQLTANEALARMLSFEKCEIAEVNPLFGKGLQTRVNAVVENEHWPRMPDYERVLYQRRPTTAVTTWEKYPVHVKAAEGDLEHVRDLLRNSLYHHSKKDSISWAPIHYAAWYGHDRVVEYLLDEGCSPNLTDHENMTPLHIAAKKGHAKVAECLVFHKDIDVNAKESTGKTAMEICTNAPDRHAGHEQVAILIRKSQTVQVHLADGSYRVLKLTKGPHTTVHMLNDQMLATFDMPSRPYGEVFTLWICSKSLELQLRPEQEPVQQLYNWTKRTISMLTDAQPSEEVPKLLWRRNVKISVRQEQKVGHHHAISLLFHEAYRNYIHAMYPCKESDAITFAALLVLLKHGERESSAVKTYVSNELVELIPEHFRLTRSNSHWVNKIAREYTTLVSRTRLAAGAEYVLKNQFLNNCQKLTVYGSAFFTGKFHLGRGNNAVLCHIGVNDVGIHIIDAQNKTMRHTYKYHQIVFQQPSEYNKELHITVRRPDGRTPGRSSPRSPLIIESKQAGMINHLMQTLAEIHSTF